MWSIGYTDPIAEDYSIDVHWGDYASFRDAVTDLYDNVEKLANDAEEYEMEHYEVVLADIRDIRDDPGIMNDSDMWEDQEFTDDFGQIVYFVVES